MEEKAPVEPVELARRAAEAVVRLTPSDRYPWLSVRVGELLGPTYRQRLADSRARLVGEVDEASSLVSSEINAWRIRFGDWLADHPDATAAFVGFVEEATAGQATPAPATPAPATPAPATPATPAPASPAPALPAPTAAVPVAREPTQARDPAPAPSAPQAPIWPAPAPVPPTQKRPGPRPPAPARRAPAPAAPPARSPGAAPLPPTGAIPIVPATAVPPKGPPPRRRLFVVFVIAAALLTVVLVVAGMAGIAVLRRAAAPGDVPPGPAGTPGAVATRGEDRPGPLLDWRVAVADLPGLQVDPLDRPQFDSLVCPSVRDCWAGGGVHPAGPGGPSPFVLHYDGTAWHQVRGSMPPPARISCLSPADCVGVGGVPDTGARRPERYDGRAWAPLGAAPAGDRTVLGVTCVDRSTCWAVGGTDLVTGAGRPVVLRYDGSAWRDMPIPRIRDRGVLTEVTCPAPDSCWVVGDMAGAGFTIIHFDGREWTEVPVDGPPFTPTGNGQGEPLLGNLQCASASQCWAFGDWNGEGAPFAMRYDGRSWALDRTGMALTPRGLNVSCTGIRNCWAVGAVPDGPGTPRVMHWDGRSWREVANPALGFPAVLTAVACPTPTECWAVGAGGGQTVPAHPLIEHALPTTEGAPPSPIQS